MEWQPIETVPEGEHVLLYWPEGEKGLGGMECATVFFEPDGWNGGSRYAYWTHGGPNSGIDWNARDNEEPTHWMPLPPPPSPAADER